MSVPKGMRGEGRFALLTAADNLACHTLHIVSNQRVFNPYYDRLINRILDNALGIDQDVYDANYVYVRDWNDYLVRRRLQDRAYRQVHSLLHQIRLARIVFHLRSGKVEHWTKLASDVKARLKGWRESDYRRWKHLQPQ